jgi:murein L,D-transpeptidase YafK
VHPRAPALLAFALVLATPALAPSEPSSAARAAAERRSAPVTEIRIDKSDHRLQLVAGEHVVKTYRVAIGPGGAGPKRWEWDMTTPVGRYRVTGRHRGAFHRFLGVSYPNRDDIARYRDLKSRGEVPAGRGVGHSIGIHGGGSERDWTAGCIALEDHEIDEVARLVSDGTTIVIRD